MTTKRDLWKLTGFDPFFFFFFSVFAHTIITNAYAINITFYSNGRRRGRGGGGGYLTVKIKFAGTTSVTVLGGAPYKPAAPTALRPNRLSVKRRLENPRGRTAAFHIKTCTAPHGLKSCSRIVFEYKTKK